MTTSSLRQALRELCKPAYGILLRRADQLVECRFRIRELCSVCGWKVCLGTGYMALRKSAVGHTAAQCFLHTVRTTLVAVVPLVTGSTTMVKVNLAPLGPFLGLTVLSTLTGTTAGGAGMICIDTQRKQQQETGKLHLKG